MPTQKEKEREEEKIVPSSIISCTDLAFFRLVTHKLGWNGVGRNGVGGYRVGRNRAGSCRAWRDEVSKKGFDRNRVDRNRLVIFRVVTSQVTLLHQKSQASAFFHGSKLDQDILQSPLYSLFQKSVSLPLKRKPNQQQR